jgi:hypothetical protein
MMNIYSLCGADIYRGPDSPDLRGRSCHRLMALLLMACMCAIPAFSSAGKHRTTGFSADLPRSYSAVKEIVGKVSSDGEIRGTSEFLQETLISGAIFARSCSFFRGQSESGEAFYKLKSGALAPAHFAGSNDSGTVAVRYAIETLGTAATRLRIDALFAEDSGHARHVSDGSVEAAEFDEIDRRFRSLDDQAKQERAATQLRALETQRNDLQRSLELEQAQLKAVSAMLQDVEVRAARLRPRTLMRVKTDSAMLLTAPLLHADSLAVLGRHEKIEVLLRTPYWFRVRTSDAKEGWIYHLLLEPAQ